MENQNRTIITKLVEFGKKVLSRVELNFDGPNGSLQINIVSQPRKEIPYNECGDQQC